MLDHLGIEQRVFEGEDLDLVGQIASSELLRRGVLFPPNIHLLTPLLEAAAGGTGATRHGSASLSCRRG